MNSPLHGIVDNELPAARKLLTAKPTLAKQTTSRAQFHRVKDSPLAPQGRHRAVRMRSAVAVESLLDADADATDRDKPGSTPFDLAVKNTGKGGIGAPEAIAGQRRIITALFAHRVNPKVKNSRGQPCWNGPRPTGFGK